MWKVLRYKDYMTPTVLSLLEKLEREIIKVYGLKHEISLLEEVDGDKKLVMPTIKVEGEPTRTISSLVCIQNWEWYSNDLGFFLDVCKKHNIDAVNLNVKTGIDGQTNAFVSAKSLDEYLKTRSKSRRKHLRKILREEYPEIEWEWATKKDEEVVKKLIFNNISWWSSKDVEGYSTLAKISSDLYSLLGFGDKGKVRLGYYKGLPVCGYIWIDFEGIWRSVMVMRDRDIDLQLGHIMQLDKVVNISEMGGEFDLGMCNIFPHKVSWSTRLEKLGAVGEGYIE